MKRLPCPSCTSSDAYHEWDDGHGYCFSCKKYFKNRGEETQSNYTYEYLPWRGISRETMAFFDIKTKIAPNGEPVTIGFRYPNGAYKVRSLKTKDFWTEGDISKEGLFGRDKFPAGSHKYVTITEGELDAASLYQLLRTPVVSVHSAVSAQRDCAVERSWLNSFERIYLAFDEDSAGKHATLAVARLFDFNKLYQVSFRPYKDANDWLRNEEGDVLKSIWWNSKRYLPETIVSSLDDFKEILSKPPEEGFPYPFPTLNTMTFGIRKGESVLITAQEGVGKTELMHAIEYKLLTESKENVGAIFLEEPKARHLQALAGQHLGRPVHIPGSGYSASEIYAALAQVVAADDRLYLYSHFGSDDPEVLIESIRFLVSARGCSFILLDHITMAVSGSSGGDDERRKLDYLSSRLEMMVKELGFALIMVSHVNDLNQTRGSRLTAKVADIRIDAFRDLNHVDFVKRNTTYLTVSKNRFSGLTGPAGALLFDPGTRTYTEVTKHADDNIQRDDAARAA